MLLEYRVKTASKEQIYSHLKTCDGSFMPPLSSRVDLLEYSGKVLEKSVSFEAWQGDVLVGMINAYFNDVSSQTGFISNVSVLKEYRRKGVATVLLQMVVEHTRALRWGRVMLEVSRGNSAAIRLYSRADFKVVGECEENLLMERQVSDQSIQ